MTNKLASTKSYSSEHNKPQTTASLKTQQRKREHQFTINDGNTKSNNVLGYAQVPRKRSLFFCYLKHFHVSKQVEILSWPAVYSLKELLGFTDIRTGLLPVFEQFLSGAFLRNIKLVGL